MKTICYGINNSHEPNFFKPFLHYFSKKGFNQHIVAHNYIEVPKLVDKMDWPYEVLGKHFGRSKIKKLFGLLSNNLEYFNQVPNFDISLSHGNAPLIYTTKIRSKLSISFTDNDINLLGHLAYFPLVDYLITPRSISTELLVRHGVKAEKIVKYDGYKEDIYIADYVPDKDFLSDFPFEKFVTLRPEALKNIYLSKNHKSIVPDLIRLLHENSINILYLPRYESDRLWGRGFPNVFSPPEPINGLDACYYSDAVLTGAGTFSREAACLGTPAVSFFPGKELLSVDRDLISQGKIFHSRDPTKIIDFLNQIKKGEPDIGKSQTVKNQVLEIVKDCIDRF